MTDSLIEVRMVRWLGRVGLVVTNEQSSFPFNFHEYFTHIHLLADKMGDIIKLECSVPGCKFVTPVVPDWNIAIRL